MTRQEGTRHRVAALIRTLEEQGDVYHITLNGEPLWWFARGRVYDKLVENTANMQGRHCQRRVHGYVSWLVCMLARLLVILGRALCGLWRSQSIGQSSGRVLLFVASNDYRGRAGSGLHAERDVFLGDVAARLGKNAVIVERPTSLQWDFRSLRFRRDAVFWDYMLVLAAIKCVLHPRPKVEGLEDFLVVLHALQEKLPLEPRLVIETIQQVVREISRKVQIQVTAAEMLLERVRPSRVLEVTSYDGACVALNLAAKKRRIPVTEMQHGMIYPSHPGYAVRVPDRRDMLLPIPEKTLVYGENFREYLSAATPLYQDRLIRVVGSPRLSKFLAIVQRNGRAVMRDSVRRKLGLQNSQVVVVMTTQKPVANRLAAFCQECLRVLPTHAHICLKPHPGELGAGLAVYRMLTRDQRVTIVTDNDIDLYELLIASDLHVSSYSTVLLEAMALGVPNFVIELEDSLSVTNLFGTGGFSVIRSPQEIVDAISRLESDPSWVSHLVERGLEAAEGFFSTSVPDPVAAILDELLR